MKIKTLLLLLCLYSGVISAQDKAEIKELFWGKNDEYKNAATIPDKWKNESAVVIYKNENYDFHKFGQNVTYTSSVRKRVKLLDQSAVNEFSEFSFKDRFYSSRGMATFFRRTATNVIGIKVVKPDGTQKEIDIDSEAVEVDEKKKIAIPNLEIGDIIDFYYYSKEPFKSKIAYGFEPVETNLGDDYPIMDLKITLKTENDFFVNFNTYNGAPELKETTVEGEDRTYELVASDIEKNDFPRWFYPLAELPCYKFQVYFARSGKYEKWAAGFLPEKESIIKKTVTKEDVLDFYDGRFEPNGYVKGIKKYLDKNNITNKEDRVREAYYYTRHNYYTLYVEAVVMDEAKIVDPKYFSVYGYPVIFSEDRQFINFFMEFLKSEKIDYDIVVATPRYNGSIKDLLIERNIVTVLKVNTDTPIYLELFNPYTNADQINYSIENSEAYMLKVAKLKKVKDIETITLPSSTYKDNTTKEALNVTISPDFTAINVMRESSLFGHNKDIDQKEKLEFYDYVDEDYEKYENTPFIDRLPGKKLREKLTKEFDALKTKLREKQKEAFEKSAEGEYGFEIDDYSIEVVSTGRFGKSTPFAYKENFTIKNELLKNAGQNYIFEVGKLIGQQAEIDQEELDRTNNIYTAFPRSFEEVIELTIPDGYTVAGLDKLNKKVENTTGGFVSTATLQGNKLTIKAYKYYANYYEPNSNWKNMVAFLDAAYQFTQEKILLKKN